jgi:hypothetical protein
MFLVSRSVTGGKGAAKSKGQKIGGENEYFKLKMIFLCPKNFNF